MKALSLRLENYLMQLIEKEAKRNGTTKVEIIKTALMNFFFNREDMIDLRLIESRQHEKDIPIEKVFRS